MRHATLILIAALALLFPGAALAQFTNIPMCTIAAGSDRVHTEGGSCGVAGDGHMVILSDGTSRPDCGSNANPSGSSGGGTVPNLCIYRSSNSKLEPIGAAGLGSGDMAKATYDASPEDGIVDEAAALENDPSGCTPGDYVEDMDADGTLICDTPTGGSGGHVIKDEGSSLTAYPNLNFEGISIACTDDDPDTLCTVYNSEAYGILGGVGSGLTLDVLRGLMQLKGLPASATYVYMSGDDTGWYPKGYGATSTAGVANEPMNNFSTLTTYLTTADVDGPIVFVLDPGEIFSLPSAFAPGGPDGDCGDTDEPCFIFMGGDVTGRERPTIKCVTGDTSNTNGWIENAAGNDTMVWSNVVFDCLNEPEDTGRKPIFYNAGDLILHNVYFDGVVGKDVRAIQTVAGSNTLGVNVSGYIKNLHDYDGDQDGNEALHCLGYLDPYYCCQSISSCLDWDEGTAYIFDIDDGNSLWIGGEWYDHQEDDDNLKPWMTFAKISGGDTTFMATTFRHRGEGQNPTTGKRSFMLSGVGTNVTFIYTTSSADEGTGGIPGGNTVSALDFLGGEASQDVDVRMFQAQFIGAERTFNFENLLGSTDNSVYGRCINLDEPDGNKDGKYYDVWAVGAFAESDLSFDIQNSMFDDDEGAETYHWKGATHDQIGAFRSDAAPAITSFFGDATDTTVGSEGSRDCGGAADVRCRGQNFNAIGGCAHTDCLNRCTTSWTETLTVVIPEIVLGPGLGVTTFLFNSPGPQNIGGRF